MDMDGKNIKEKLLANLAKETSGLKFKPTLAIIQVGHNDASDTYIKQKIKMLDYIGFKGIIKKYLDNTDESEIIKDIIDLNNNKDIDGILIQLPLPNNFDVIKLQNTVDKNKDVDGLNSQNMINLINNQECFIPCTPLGILKLLEYYNISVEGKNVVIVGRSNLVAKPLLHILLNKNATVTMCHSKTKDLSFHTKNADILIVAVGHKHLIKKDMIKKNSIIIDAGINRENNKLYGDVDYENIKDIVSYITPVPGGVGPMTVAMLAENLYKAYKLNHK